jgi:hypothetical protein
MANLSRYDLVKADQAGWELKSGGKVVGWFESKRAALDPGGMLQMILDRLSGGEGTVRIHNEKGGFEEERTFPRSKDPRESPG